MQLVPFLSKDMLNIAGVVMATVGACLLWYFVGEVVTVNREEILAGQDVAQTIPANSPELRCRIRLHKCMTRIGVSLTVVGGILQVASTLF